MTYLRRNLDQVTLPFRASVPSSTEWELNCTYSPRVVRRTQDDTGKAPLDSKEMSASDLNTHDMPGAIASARDSNGPILRHLLARGACRQTNQSLM